MSELKPCPFCGGDAVLEYIDNFDVKGNLIKPDLEHVYCSNKSCILAWGAEACYINRKNWNTRAGEPE